MAMCYIMAFVLSISHTTICEMKVLTNRKKVNSTVSEN